MAVIVACALLVVFAISSAAQEPERLRGLEATFATVPDQGRSRLILPPEATWLPPEPVRLGIFTVVPPETRGEFVRVSVPIGDLTTRLTRSFSRARRHRAEREARKTVERALREFREAEVR